MLITLPSSRRVIALVIVRHRASPATLDRQARLSSIERLNLALFIATKYQSMLGRVQIEVHNRLEFFCKLKVATFLCQMRRTLASLIPTASAMVRVDPSNTLSFWGSFQLALNLVEM